MRKIETATKPAALRFKLDGSNGFEIKRKGGIMKHLQKLCAVMFVLFLVPPNGPGH